MLGKIICKGSLGDDVDFIRHFKDLIISTNHFDPKVRQTKKVVLITAAWTKSEFNEQHLKRIFREIGIPSIYRQGFDENIQNLSIYHAFEQFKGKCPDLYQMYHAKQEVIRRIKLFYQTKNQGMIDTYWEQVQLLRQFFPEMSLYDILTYRAEEPTVAIADLPVDEIERYYYCRQVQQTLQNIIVYDERMVQTINEIEQDFFDRSRLRQNQLYQEIRNLLRDRILSANAMFIFDGNISVLRNRIRFFDLREYFVEALHRGTNIFSVGAGSEILCDKMLFFNKAADSKKAADYFEFYDNGLGLIQNIQILPQNSTQIDLTDADFLTHVSTRFNTHTSVCLDKESYLFIETKVDEKHDSQSQRYIALGDSDYLYVFNKEGQLDQKRAGEELFPGRELKQFYSLIARRTQAHLVELLKRVHHLEKIKGYADITTIVNTFISLNEFPLREGLTTTFFYYDPERKVRAIYLASSLGHGDDSHTFYQYKNTGIFYLPVEFQAMSRLEYKFILDYGNEQYRDILDPNNPEKAYSPFGANSVMTTLDFQKAPVTIPNARAMKGTLTEFVFTSQIMGDKRSYKLYTPPDTKAALPVVVFHDGNDYLNYSNLQIILDNMIHERLINPFIGVFSQPVNRMEEYAVNPAYAEFITRELLAHVGQQRAILTGPENTCSVGASLGGLLSIYLLATYPMVFGKVISQSGSFFMKRGGFKSLAEQHPHISDFMHDFMKGSPMKSSCKIVLTCGRFESLIYVNRIMVDTLDRFNCQYRYFEYNDSHTWTGWANTMPTALVTLFGRSESIIDESDAISPRGIIAFHDQVQKPFYGGGLE